MSGMVGHEAAWREWRSAIGGGRKHHAWLLTGKRGLGKASFAHDAARELVAKKGAPSTGPHPDILTLQREPDDKEAVKRDAGKSFTVRRNITVDQVRALQRKLTTRPTLGPWRAIVIDSADEMEKGAANALLKSLEEPPQGSLFLLVSHQPARLLPTIRSRCRTIRFAPLDEAAMVRVLMDRSPDADADARHAAIAATAGSPGAALEFLGRGLAPVHNVIQSILSSSGECDASSGRLLDVAGTRPDRERISAILALARGSTARAALSKDGSSNPAMIEAHSRLVELEREAPTYNFDPGLLLAQVGAILAASSKDARAGA